MEAFRLDAQMHYSSKSFTYEWYCHDMNNEQKIIPLSWMHISDVGILAQYY